MVENKARMVVETNVMICEFLIDLLKKQKPPFGGGFVCDGNLFKSVLLLAFLLCVSCAKHRHPCQQG
jgi:hypothetical protein